MTIVDTSALVRFFVKDYPAKAAKVKELLESDEELCIPEAVFVELGFVLGRLYRVSRRDLGEIFNFLASRRSTKVTPDTIEAVALFGKSNLSLADCLVTVAVKGGKLASFDEQLLKTKGVRSYW